MKYFVGVVNAFQLEKKKKKYLRYSFFPKKCCLDQCCKAIEKKIQFKKIHSSFFIFNECCFEKHDGLSLFPKNILLFFIYYSTFLKMQSNPHILNLTVQKK